MFGLGGNILKTYFDYMIMASKDSDRDGELWFRYLRKVRKDEGTKLTEDDINRLLRSHVLSSFQKVTLQDALNEGTYTREHILGLSRRHKPNSEVVVLAQKYGLGHIYENRLNDINEK